MMRLTLIVITLFLVGAVSFISNHQVALGYNLNDDFCFTAPVDTETGRKPDICYADKPTENPIVGADGLLTTVVGFFALITGIISVIVIILMGFRYVTANGDANKAASARQGIIYAIAGLIVALLAQAIVMFVLNKLE